MSLLMAMYLIRHYDSHELEFEKLSNSSSVVKNNLYVHTHVRVHAHTHTRAYTQNGVQALPSRRVAVGRLGTARALLTAQGHDPGTGHDPDPGQGRLRFNSIGLFSNGQPIGLIDLMWDVISLSNASPALSTESPAHPSHPVWASWRPGPGRARVAGPGTGQGQHGPQPGHGASKSSESLYLGLAFPRRASCPGLHWQLPGSS